MKEIDPRIIQIWNAAPTILIFDEEREAEALRHQLYYARRVLLAEHPGLKDYKITIAKDGSLWRLQIKNVGKLLDQAIARAGINIPEPPDLD
jgi:hemin uptake protein HemP